MGAKPWSVIASRIVFTHPNMTLAEDTLVLPSGRRTAWLRVDAQPDSVCIICVDGDRVLIASQYNPPVGRAVGEFPGGVVEAGESTEDAARRELTEEVSLYPRQLREIGAFLINNRRSSARQHVFVATAFEPRRAVGDREEFIEAEWMPRATLEARIRSGELDNATLLAAWSIFRASE